MNNINVGRINGNALCGLCEKVCIRVDKVLDGCKCFFSGVREDNIPVAFSEGSAPTAPYNFVAVEGTGGVTAQNMTVSSADAGRLRISYNALFPRHIDGGGSKFFVLHCDNYGAYGKKRYSSARLRRLRISPLHRRGGRVRRTF